MSSGGQISVEIALQGADSFDSALDGVSGKLTTLKTNAGSAGAGVSGLGTNAQQGAMGVNALGEGSASTATKVLAAGGAISSAAGFALSAVGSYEDLSKSDTTLARDTKSVEAATISYHSVHQKLLDMMKAGTATPQEYAKAVLKIQEAYQTVQKDEGNIQTDEAKIQKLWNEGKQNTPEYAAAVRKLGEDQGKLAIDTSKLSDTQKAYSDLVQKHVDMTSPAMQKALALDKEKFDALNVVTEKQKNDIDSNRLAHVQFYQTILSQGLSAFGSILTAVGLFSSGVGKAGKDAEGFAGTMSGLPARMGVIGIVLAALAAAFALIGTNAFGIRDKLEAFGKAIGDANPNLRPFLELIQAIGDNIGLTGKGFFTSGGEITKALGDIQSQLSKGDIGKGFKSITDAINEAAKAAGPDLKKISDAIIAFFKNPGIGTGTELGKTLLTAISDGFHYAMDNLPKAIDFVGKAMNDALKRAMPTLDAVGAAIINGIDDLVTHPGNAKDGIIKFLTWLFTDLSKINAAINKAIDDLLATALDSKNTPQTRAAFVKLLTDLGTAVSKGAADLWKGLSNLDTWKTILTDIETQLAKLGDWMKTNAYEKIWKPLSNTDTWKTILTDVETQLAKLGDWMKTNAYEKIWKPLSNVDTWKTILTDIETQLSALGTWLGSNAYEKILKPLGNEQNWKTLLTDMETQLGGLATWLTSNAYEKILKPLGNQQNWKTLLTDMETQLGGLATWLTTNAYEKILKPIGSQQNWKTLLTDMETQIEGLATWLTTNAYEKVLKPLGSQQNWKNLLSDMETQIGNLSQWLTTNAYEKILKPLGSDQVWGQLITDIETQLEKVAIWLGQQIAAVIANAMKAVGGVAGPQVGGTANAIQQGLGQFGQAVTNAVAPHAAMFAPNAPVNTANFAATFAPNAPVNTIPITLLVTIDGKNVATSLRPYILSGSGALT